MPTALAGMFFTMVWPAAFGVVFAVWVKSQKWAENIWHIGKEAPKSIW